MKYRKKPVVIDALLWTGRNVGDLRRFFAEGDFSDWGFMDTEFVEIKTLEGSMTANPGDYIIKGVKGEFYPCKPDIFLITYEVEQMTTDSRWLTPEQRNA